MGMSTVQVPEKKEGGPSALENAAKILGIAVNVGNTGFKAYDVFKGAAGTAGKAVDVGSVVSQNKNKIIEQGGYGGGLQ